MLNSNNQQNIILAAIETSTSDLWDLDDEFIGTALQSQAHLLAGHDSDLIDSDYAIH
jgi:hypothetical protein